jgi:inner membrane protein
MAAKAYGKSEQSERLYKTAVVLSVLPDADVFGFKLGISYGAFLGHRGFFHSLCFALLMAIACGLRLSRGRQDFAKSWWRYVLFFGPVGASHGILDALTNGGMGIALLAPFDNQRYFFPWTPIPVAPIGLGDILNDGGWLVILYEIFYLWLPMALILLVLHFIRRRRARFEKG